MIFRCTKFNTFAQSSKMSQTVTVNQREKLKLKYCNKKEKREKSRLFLGIGCKISVSLLRRKLFFLKSVVVVGKCQQVNHNKSEIGPTFPNWIALSTGRWKWMWMSVLVKLLSKFHQSALATIGIKSFPPHAETF